ncbi:MAG: DUF4445 domain-containing protein [Clostridiales bacterium]|nr:DUF4445 domain-containing protein [Clostridiales bacterium]
MGKAIIVTGDKTLHTNVYTGQPVGDLLKREGIPFSFPCGGNHTCGKCQVYIEGDVSPMTEQEKKLLGSANPGMRLACFCTIMGDVFIKVHNEEANILAKAAMPDIDMTEKGYGIACDIGTTTVVVRLYKLESGEVLAERSEENEQKSYGADVISRIVSSKGEGLSVLSQLIRNQLERMISECMTEASIMQINKTVITGNTTMLHIYENLDPSSIAVVPFETKSLFGELSNYKHMNAEVYIPRCIGAYIGADIVCAILASEMLEKDKCALIVDIGTNGEMALLKNGELICCATAAGPAFEGAGLSMGMMAKNGAIDSVVINNDDVSYTVIGNTEAKGICGSGILDAVYVMKEKGIIDETGYLEEDFVIGDSKVLVSQNDIRQIQLAKSAICAGIYTLIHDADVSMEEIETLYVAGGFGNHVNMVSATGIGLLPSELLNKIKFIGNGALAGASMILLNNDMLKKSEEISKKAKELHLSESAYFMDKYIDLMYF